MSKNYDARWANALTVVQEAQPPFIPEGAHAKTVVIEYPPRSTGAPPHKHPSGPPFGYMLEGRDARGRRRPRQRPAGRAGGWDDGVLVVLTTNAARW